MGQATRNIANSFTTSGVITSSAVNNTTISGITDLSAGGSLILISTSTASSDATVNITSGIDSTYDEYLILLTNIHPSANGPNHGFQATTDGSNFNVTQTTSHFRARHSEDDAVTVFGYDTGNDIAQGTTYQSLGSPAYDNDCSLNGWIKLYNPSSTTYVKHWISNTVTFEAGNGGICQPVYNGGYFNTTSAITGVSFKFSAGNIDSGTYQLFGVK